MKVTAWQCDKCGKQFDSQGGKTIEIEVDESKNISTGEWDVDIKRADLCVTCLCSLLHYVLGVVPSYMRTSITTIWW